MAEIGYIEQQRLEKILGMKDGWCLDLSNGTLNALFMSHVGINIYEGDKYECFGGSKANRIRAFWKLESNALNAKMLRAFAEYYDLYLLNKNEVSEAGIVSKQYFLQTAEKLESFVSGHTSVLRPLTDELDFAKLCNDIKDSIEKDQPDVVLDRLHTFMVKHVRTLCEKHGIEYEKAHPLHGVFGSYVKHLRTKGHVESGMSERIMVSSTKILEDFNYVRNNKSLAHANGLLNYDESMFIFKSISSLVEFVNALESRIDNRTKEEAKVIRMEDQYPEDLPF
ncbi:MAG: hypothetical protein EOO15_18010 [Chitinophagaceae bacterium]|nr:MAG: hypothetical protein EOO15_18010 [Chitinophagaceae bacterium]